MHGSILPVTTPPGNPRDKSIPSGLGVGNCLQQSCPGGRGRGKSKITSFCSCEVRHFSVDTMAKGSRAEDGLFPGKISRICSRLVRENNLSKFKSVFEGTFIIYCCCCCLIHFYKQQNIYSLRCDSLVFKILNGMSSDYYHLSQKHFKAL